MKMKLALAAMAALVCACGSAGGDTEGTSERSPNDWLLNAESDTERFELLQRYLRGFDQPMWEVGERYVAVFRALERENFDLAAYHWDKIRTTIENGYLKRPARRANADEVFLDSLWGKVRDALVSGNTETAWKGFALGRDACMRCHVAESMPFMNDQPMFELLPPDVTAP